MIIEAKKEWIKYKDAINFHSKFQTNLHENISTLSPKERQQRKAIVQKDMMELTDKMSGKDNLIIKIMTSFYLTMKKYIF